jgi:hypothetical protein
MVICLPQRPQCRGRPSSPLTVGIEPENVDGHGGGRDLTHNPVSRANGPASERLTSSLTVARDLGKRSSAQRWAGPYSHGGSPRVLTARLPTLKPSYATTWPTRSASRRDSPATGSAYCTPSVPVTQAHMLLTGLGIERLARPSWPERELRRCQRLKSAEQAREVGVTATSARCAVPRRAAGEEPPAQARPARGFQEPHGRHPERPPSFAVSTQTSEGRSVCMALKGTQDR